MVTQISQPNYNIASLAIGTNQTTACCVVTIWYNRCNKLTTICIIYYARFVFLFVILIWFSISVYAGIHQKFSNLLISWRHPGISPTLLISNNKGTSAHSFNEQLVYTNSGQLNDIWYLNLCVIKVISVSISPSINSSCYKVRPSG
jgi:hypothetical protein